MYGSGRCLTEWLRDIVNGGREMADTGSGTCLTLSFALSELSVVEQRYQAVLAVIRDGHSAVDVASRWGCRGRRFMPGCGGMRTRAWTA